MQRFGFALALYTLKETADGRFQETTEYLVDLQDSELLKIKTSPDVPLGHFLFEDLESAQKIGASLVSRNVFYSGFKLLPVVIRSESKLVSRAMALDILSKH